MKASKKIYMLILVVFSIGVANSQNCDNELATIGATGTNNDTYVVPSVGITCVSNDLTIAYLKIEDGGKLIVKSGAKLTILNGIVNDNTPSHQNTIEIFGEILTNTAITFPVSSKITVQTSGNFSCEVLTFNGNTLTLINYGTMQIGGIDFNNDSSINTIENHSTLAVSNNINMNGSSTVYFKNSANLNVSNNYNNNVNSVLVNCGATNIGTLNIAGGKVYSSGTINFSGKIDFGSETSLLENYGNINGQSLDLGGGTSYLYNSGNINLNSSINNDGHLKGPTTGTNYGKISFNGVSTIVNGSITGRLNITNPGNTATASIFAPTVTIGTDVLFGFCQTCVITITDGICRNPNGSSPPCTQTGATGTPANYTKIVISNLETPYLNLPSSTSPGIPNGFIALESHTQGMVISRVQDSSAITDPKKGMLIYDISASCVKLYNGTFWNCIEKSCND